MARRVVTSGTLQKVLHDRILAKLQRYSPKDPAVKRVLLQIGALLEREAKLNASRRGGLKVQTGALWNSIKSKLETEGNVSSLYVGSFGVKYAAIHEFGGKIEPIPPKQWLTIPLEKKYRKLRARQTPGLFFVTINEKLFLAKTKEDNTLELAYLLRKSVFMPPRPYLRPALENNKLKIIDMLRALVRE